MGIYIDADGCPVVNQAIRAGKQGGAGGGPAVRHIHVFSGGARTITVSKGADSVDFAW